MNDAIRERVDQFVREIFGLVEQVSTERRAAALRTVGALLAGAGDASRTIPSPARRPSTSRGGASSRRGQPRRPRFASGEAPVPAAIAHPRSAGAADGAPAREADAPRVGAPRESGAPASTTLPDGPLASSSRAAGPAPEREALVLGAVRALERATASEVAARTGQPNGSVAVALRTLVGRGLVAKAQTSRGVEYSVVSMGKRRASSVAAT